MGCHQNENKLFFTQKANCAHVDVLYEELNRLAETRLALKS